MSTVIRGPFRLRSYALLVSAGLVALLGLFATGCGSESGSEATGEASERNGVVVTIFPLYDLVRQVAGDEIPVTLMLAPGRTPHQYELTPADLLDLRKAELLVTAGGGVDSWVDQPARDQEESGLRVINLYELAGGDPNIAAAAHDHEHDHDHAHHDHGDAALNPHQWLVPHTVEFVVERVRDELAARHPDQADAIDDRASQVLEMLHDIDAEYRAAIEPIDDRRLVTFHDAFNPLADEFGLDVVAEIYSTRQRDLTASQMNEIRQLLDAGVRAVFIEPQLDSSAARFIGESIELRVLDPLGGRTDEPGYATYAEMMRSNLKALVEGLNANESDGG